MNASSGRSRSSWRRSTPSTRGKTWTIRRTRGSRRFAWSSINVGTCCVSGAHCASLATIQTGLKSGRQGSLRTTSSRRRGQRRTHWDPSERQGLQEPSGLVGYGGSMNADSVSGGTIQRDGHALRPGEIAPEFTLKSTPDQSVSLSEFRGQPVILAFYPADWSPVCGDQMGLYNEVLPEFRRHGAELLGISVDGAWCHAAFSSDRKLHFPLLADFEPKGAVARAYGVYRASDGFTERALFVIDADGVIRWSHVSPVGVNPGAEGILAALESLQHEESKS